MNLQDVLTASLPQSDVLAATGASLSSKLSNAYANIQNYVAGETNSVWLQLRSGEFEDYTVKLDTPVSLLADSDAIDISVARNSSGGEVLNTISVPVDDILDSLQIEGCDVLALNDIIKSVSSSSSIDTLSSKISLLLGQYKGTVSMKVLAVIDAIQTSCSMAILSNSDIAMIQSSIFSSIWSGYHSTKPPASSTDYYTIPLIGGSYSKSTAASAFLSSLDINLSWDNFKDSVISIGEAIYAGLVTISNWIAGGILSLWNKVKEATVDPVAFVLEDGFSNKYPSLEGFPAAYMVPCGDGVIQNKAVYRQRLGEVYNNFFGTQLPLLDAEKIVFDAFENHVQYSFKIPGKEIAVMKDRTKGLLVSSRPILYSYNVKWDNNGTSWTYPLSVDQLYDQVVRASQVGFTNNYLASEYVDTDHKVMSSILAGDNLAVGYAQWLCTLKRDPNATTIASVTLNSPAITGLQYAYGLAFQKLTAADIWNHWQTQVPEWDKDGYYLYPKLSLAYADFDASSDAYGPYGDLMIALALKLSPANEFFCYNRVTSYKSGSVALADDSYLAGRFSNFLKTTTLVAAAVVATAVCIKVTPKLLGAKKAAAARFARAQLNYDGSDSTFKELKIASRLNRLLNGSSSGSSLVGSVSESLSNIGQSSSKQVQKDVNKVIHLISG